MNRPGAVPQTLRGGMPTGFGGQQQPQQQQQPPPQQPGRTPSNRLPNGKIGMATCVSYSDLARSRTDAVTGGYSDKQWERVGLWWQYPGYEQCRTAKLVETVRRKSQFCPKSKRLATGNTARFIVGLGLLMQNLFSGFPYAAVAKAYSHPICFHCSFAHVLSRR
ncbi:hypothetical protein BJ170DRAFT_252588 [Xylariales sp. AK1849]|nr:hypothetical protein BJ170DRAFT_252588 [Xylariales sp. AK1849]